MIGRMQPALKALSADYKKLIGSRVREARKSRKLTQDELAGRSGMKLTSVSDIERGLRIPTLDSLYALAQVLEVPLRTFVPDPTEATPDEASKLMEELTAAAHRLDADRLKMVVTQVKALAEG